jgi:hypothetical protein
MCWGDQTGGRAEGHSLVPEMPRGGAAAAFRCPGVARPGVVRHGASASGGVAAGDAGDVVAGFHVGFNGHDGSPCGYGARWSRHGHRVMHRYNALGLECELALGSPPPHGRARLPPEPPGPVPRGLCGRSLCAG